HSSYAEFSVAIGDFERGVTHYMRALELQPDDYRSPLMLEQVLRSLGRRKEGERYARLGLKRAEAELQQHPESSYAAQIGAASLATIGERELALEWMARALAIDPDDNLARYNAACVYSLLGEADQAIDLLEVWIRQVGPDMKRWFKNDADFEPIRSHPRYQQLLALGGL